MTSMTWDPESPSLRETILCYADILGFRARTERAINTGEEVEFLQEVKRSLSAAYEKFREAKRFDGEVLGLFDMKVFTDNIVVAYPLQDPGSDRGEPELFDLISIFAELQAGLAADGFLLRGAIATGRHYQDDDIAYGKALLEAVDLDKSGGSPRLVIAQSVERLILEHLSWYGRGSAPHYEILLEDPSDGWLFVNYLEAAFWYFPEGPIYHEVLEAHSKNVRTGLWEHESNASVREKYEWVACYHNYVCSTFVARHSVQNLEEADDERMAYGDEAQHVLKYLVPFEKQPGPRPLDAQRLQQRVSEGLE